MQQLTVNPLTFFNLAIALGIVGYSLFYFLKGRAIDRAVMLVNLFAGSWAFVAISFILYDRLIQDIFPEHITRWIISSTMFVVLSTKLANILRIGKRQNGIG
jgi:hypothetical protein